MNILPIENLEMASSSLAASLGVEVRNYSTFDFGREKNELAVSFIISEEKALEFLPKIRDSLGDGLIAFIGTTRWLGDERHSGVEVVVAHGTSQFDILKVARSDAANYNMETEDLIKKLQDYNHKYGIDIFQAETDTIRLNVLQLPSDINSFARDLYSFCPDIVDQGVGSVDALEQAIINFREVYLWWD